MHQCYKRDAKRERERIKGNNNERKKENDPPELQKCLRESKKRKEREKIKKMTVEKRNKTKEKRKGEEKDLETNVGPLRRVVSLPEFLKELSGHSENNDDSDAVRE